MTGEKKEILQKIAGYLTGFLFAGVFIYFIEVGKFWLICKVLGVGVIIVLLTIVILVTQINYNNINLLSKIILTAIGKSSPPEMSNDWAMANHFKYVGEFATNMGVVSTSIFVWRHSAMPSFFCQYNMTAEKKNKPGAQTPSKIKTSYDFITVLDNGFGLTTASSLDSHFLPSSSNSYMQSFSNMSLDDIWNQHFYAERFLVDFGGAILGCYENSFEELFINSLRSQAEFIRKLWLWPLRGVYWFFIRKRLWHNKSIQMQYEKDMIKLPKEFLEAKLSGKKAGFLCSSQD